MVRAYGIKVEGFWAIGASARYGLGVSVFRAQEDHGFKGGIEEIRA